MSLMLVFHVVISLAGLATAVPVTRGLLTNTSVPGWTLAFFFTNILTSLSGFGLPAPHFMPSHAFAIAALVALTIAAYARYRAHCAGGWRRAYLTGALMAFYLNSFVLIVQLFLKVPALHAMAPNQNEAPFALAQLACLAFFVALGRLADKRFRPTSTGA